MHVKDLVPLHYALMMRHITDPYIGQDVTLHTAYDISQAVDRLKREMRYFTAQLDAADLSEWEEEFNNLMRDEMREEIETSIAVEEKFEEDHWKIVQDLCKV